MDLESSALEDPVLGPGAGKVLDAGNLGVGDLPARPEASDPVAVGVAGEVPDQRATAGDHVDERLGVSGVDAEVRLRAGPRRRVPRVVAAVVED